ncbi:MAG: 2,3-epoxybenzoyl-CoA dihydrolase [Pseudomonadales bacterium]|mgnify:CR=1 FL=1|jgi:benzoyl-CoA-dihydrodiol lyase|nr:benzoyl-CoA-dihydrodiol lyase [Gammaproteobacteria bacterium]MDP6025628.1 2,3-epoxybenzoyl-CoA dihydrolase [Pseudomonadales bacterium]MDP7314331.1 2,3-epoxybenzoyl-CoA dihydrolase [Pseudomonadales bacterium]
MAKHTKDPINFSFEAHPSTYRHIQMEVNGAVATLKLNIQEQSGMVDGYDLKLNSYDIGVDLELADAVNRLRFEHPEVGSVIITSALDGVFSSGANIFMLGSSSHAFKVNFCKFTNETRLSIEDATAFSGQTYIAALNGIASGGGYELPLACEEIYLVDDRRAAVSLPEVPYLGVLPGTGGLTRVVDKRKVRRDLADIFCTLAEGIKGKRAVKWGLVDAVFPPSKFNEAITERATALADGGHPDRKGVALEALNPTIDEEGIHYQHVKLLWDETPRTARLELTVPDDITALPEDAATVGCSWFPLQAFREMDDALLRLRFQHPEIGLVLLKTKGAIANVVRLDNEIMARQGHWFVREVLLLMKRVLKRLDMSAKSFFALIDEGSCFAGSLLELALAADRSYMLEEDGVQLAVSPLNGGLLPMGNGLTRLQTRFLNAPEHVDKVLSNTEPMEAIDAEDAGMVTTAYDGIGWEDELRLAIEERVSMSPDALTGMEANLRYAGPETMETKIFGRLTAWQNWIFQRPNTVGEKGALTLYGEPESAEFDFRRT